MPSVPPMATTPPRFPDRCRRLVVAMMLVVRVMASRLRCIETPGADRSCMANDVVVSQRRRRHPRRLRTPRRLSSVHWYVDNVDIDHRHPDNDTRHQTTTRRAIRCARPSLTSSMSTRDAGRRHRSQKNAPSHPPRLPIESPPPSSFVIVDVMRHSSSSTSSLRWSMLS